MDRLEKCELAIKKGFTYNPIDGVIKNPSGGISKAKTVNGYIKISIWFDKKRHSLLGHQFAWYLEKKEIVYCIDHINRDKTDNSINNLRSVTKSQNAYNMKNVKGYTFCKRSKKYIAMIMVNYKRKTLGTFDTPKEASKCYLENKNKYHVIN